jgi:hypothetical protein
MASGRELRFKGHRWSLAAALALLMMCATTATAQAPPVPQREVVVTGQAPKDIRQQQLRAFVKRRAVLNNGEGLARWTTPICPVVTGMSEDQGKYVLVRLIQAAREAGAPVIDDGRCHANAYIIATPDPERLLKAWSRRSPAIFGAGQAGEVRRFEQTPRPVRAWYNARLDALTTSADSPFEGLEISRKLPVIHHADDTRAHSNSPYALSSAIIVIDSGRVAGTNMGALADYVAVTALAQLTPQADGDGAPSILGLFASPKDPPDGLTAWDKAFLHALYHTSLEDLHQSTTIAIRMDEELSRPAPAP